MELGQLRGGMTSGQPNMPCTDVPKSSMQGSVERIASNLNNIDSTVQFLHERLGPILNSNASPSMPKNKETNKVSPLHDVMDQWVERLYCINDSLNSLLNRIDL